jgi:tetratricopeptide (TPR) repeat protein
MPSGPQTITCTTCGSKLSASRDRCPKCRTAVVRSDPAAEAARSRRLATIAGAILAVFVVSLGIVWAFAVPGEEPVVTAVPQDPLAARRHAAPVNSEPALVSPAAGGSRADTSRFMDPAAAAAQAYAGGDYATAQAQFEAAVRQNPDDPEAVNNLGQVLVKLGRAADALPLFERACAMNPDRWSYRFNLARALSQLSRWDEAIASYRQAQQLYPDDYVTTFNLALSLHKKGDEGAAVEEYRKAIALNPHEASYQMAIGISYEALNNTKDAAAAYGEYLRLAPNAADAEKVRERIARLTGQPLAPAGDAPTR